MLTGSIYN